MSDERISSRLYVVVETGAAAADRLSAALAAAEVASVLIRAPVGLALDAQDALPLVKAAQAANAAALLADDPALVRVLKADGVHLSASEDPAAAYEEAREILGDRYIVGADAGASRDDAMTLAELGADYIAFSRAGTQDVAWRDELVAWWAEIFQVPCVALDVGTGEEAAQLQAARADFIGVALPGDAPPAAAQTLLRNIAAALVAARAETHA